MSGFINLPTFVAKQGLTAAQLNALTAALNGYSAQTADIAWPLLVGGNIDFTGTSYTIDGLKSFWNIINAGEYSGSTQLQDAIDAAVDAGGGLVLLPPDTTITTTGVTIDSDKVVIMGCGPSSIVQLSSGNGPIFACGTSQYDDLAFINFAIDGNSTGSGVNAIKLQRNTRVTIADMYIYNVVGNAIAITHDGTPSNSSSNVRIQNTRVSGGSGGAHLSVADVQNLSITNFESISAGAGAILMEPATAAAYLQDITINGAMIDSPTGKGISILGASATANALWSRISVDNCTVIGATGDSFELGAASKLLKDVLSSGCKAISAGADGMNVAASGGMIDTFYCPTPASAANGLDTTGSDNVVIGTTNIFGAAGGGANYVADVAQRGRIANIDTASHSTTATGTLSGFSVTVPKNTVRVGDMLRITLHWQWDVASGTLAAHPELEGVAMTGIGVTATGGGTAYYYIFPAATSGANNTEVNHMLHSTTAGANGSGNASPLLTVDWEQDVEITIDVTDTDSAANTIEVQGVIVDLIGGV